MSVAGSHPDGIALAELQFLLAIVGHAPFLQLRGGRRNGLVIQEKIDAAGHKGKRQQHDDQAARRCACRPDGGDLVAVAEFHEGEKERQQNAHGQECCQGRRGPHQHVFEHDARAALVQGENFLGIGDDFEGQHKNGDPEQNAEKAGHDHAGEHPANGLHGRAPKPIRRASGSQRRLTPAPNVSMTPPMRSGFKVKQAV